MQRCYQGLKVRGRTRTWSPRTRTRTCKLVLEDKDKDFPRGQQHWFYTHGEVFDAAAAVPTDAIVELSIHGSIHWVHRLMQSRIGEQIQSPDRLVDVFGVSVFWKSKSVVRRLHIHHLQHAVINCWHWISCLWSLGVILPVLWLGGLLVERRTSVSIIDARFDSRPSRCRAKTLGKFLTPSCNVV